MDKQQEIQERRQQVRPLLLEHKNYTYVAKLMNVDESTIRADAKAMGLKVQTKRGKPSHLKVTNSKQPVAEVKTSKLAPYDPDNPAQYYRDRLVASTETLCGSVTPADLDAFKVRLSYLQEVARHHGLYAPTKSAHLQIEAPADLKLTADEVEMVVGVVQDMAIEPPQP